MYVCMCKGVVCRYRACVCVCVCECTCIERCKLVKKSRAPLFEQHCVVSLFLRLVQLLPHGSHVAVRATIVRHVQHVDTRLRQCQPRCVGGQVFFDVSENALHVQFADLHVFQFCEWDVAWLMSQHAEVGNQILLVAPHLLTQPLQKQMVVVLCRVFGQHLCKTHLRLHHLPIFRGRCVPR